MGEVSSFTKTIKIGIPLLVLVLFGYGIYDIVLYRIYDTFRYKQYHDYTFLLVENGKRYKMNTFNLVRDNFKEEYYIILATNNDEGFRFSPIEDLQGLISIDKGNYRIEDSNSRFYEGIVWFDDDDSVTEEVSKEEITINKSIVRREIKINYKGSQLELLSTSNSLDKKLKKTRSILMAVTSGGGLREKTYRSNYYGLPISDLNEKFDLKLNIEVDNTDKIVYFIKGE